MEIALALGLTLFSSSLVRPGECQGDLLSILSGYNLNYKEDSNDKVATREDIKLNNDPFNLFAMPFAPFDLSPPVDESAAPPVAQKFFPQPAVAQQRSIRDASHSAVTIRHQPIIKHPDGEFQSRANEEQENIMSLMNSFLPFAGLPWFDYDDNLTRNSQPLAAGPGVISIVRKTEHLPKRSHQKMPVPGTEKDSVVLVQRIGVGGNTCRGNICDGSCKNAKCPVKITKTEREYRKNLFDKLLFMIIPGIIGLGVLCVGIEMLKKHREISRKCLIVTDIDC